MKDMTATDLSNAALGSMDYQRRQNVLRLAEQIYIGRMGTLTNLSGAPLLFRAIALNALRAAGAFYDAMDERDAG